MALGEVTRRAHIHDVDVSSFNIRLSSSTPW